MNIQNIFTVSLVSVAVMILSGCQKSDEESLNVPVITAMVPETARPGESVTVYGANFDMETVLYIDEMICPVEVESAGKLTFQLPESCIGGIVRISNSQGSGEYSDFHVDTGISIDRFFPERVTVCDTLVVVGSGFDVRNTFKNRVTLIASGQEYQPFRLERVTANSLVLTVQEEFPQRGSLKVEVGDRSLLAQDMLIYIKHIRMTSFSPERGGDGSVITIKGENFDPVITPELSVTCGDKKLEVVDMPDLNTLRVRIPKELNISDTIRLSTKTFGEAKSNGRFRYHYPCSVDLGTAGILYDSQEFQITQNKVDSILAMGAKYVTCVCSFDQNLCGFINGNLPDDKRTLDNVVKIKQMSGGKLKTILILNTEKKYPEGYAGVTLETIRKFFDNLKTYEYNGLSVWDATDAFQVLYNSAKLPAGQVTGGQMNDFVSYLLRPIWELFHPTGVALAGEKMLVGPQAIAANNNVLTIDNTLSQARYYDYIDFYSFMWNLSTAETSKVYYSRNVPMTAFTVAWNSFITRIVTKYNIPFICELGFNPVSAPYIKVEQNEAALRYMIQEMQKLSNFKGFAYSRYHANDYGIRSLQDKTDNRSQTNQVIPSKNHYEMYESLVQSLAL